MRFYFLLFELTAGGTNTLHATLVAHENEVLLKFLCDAGESTDWPYVVPTGVCAPSKSHWAVAMKKRLEKWAARKPHPAARIYAQVSIKNQLFKYLNKTQTLTDDKCEPDRMCDTMISDSDWLEYVHDPLLHRYCWHCASVHIRSAAVLRSDTRRIFLLTKSNYLLLCYAYKLNTANIWHLPPSPFTTWSCKTKGKHRERVRAESAYVSLLHYISWNGRRQAGKLNNMMSGFIKSSAGLFSYTQPQLGGWR